MIIKAQPILCRGFVCCIGSFTDGETDVKDPADWMNNGNFTQLLYIINGPEDGKAAVYDENNNPVIYIPTGSNTSLFDLRDYYGKPHQIKAFNNISGAWMAINPIPANKFFYGELLSEDTVIKGEKGLEKYVICAKNKITVNDKELKQPEYVYIRHGKTANISIPAGSKAIYLTR
jgi:hypothetical protein